MTPHRELRLRDCSNEEETMRHHRLSMLCALFLLISVTSGVASEWTLRNPARRTYSNELVRLDLAAPDGTFKVTQDGVELSYQVEKIGDRAWVWVCTSLDVDQERTFDVVEGKPARGDALVSVKEKRDVITLDNGLFAVRLPAGGKEAVCPISQVRLPSGKNG